MTEANKDEAEKCKRVAHSALAGGDTEKAVRFLQKAKRMCPSDASIDALLAQAASGAGHSSGDPAASGDSGGARSAAAEGPRYRGSSGGAAAGGAGAGKAAGGARMGKDGGTYTPEQMQLVQRILRTKDYYDILEVQRDTGEDGIKKAYKKLALKLHPDKNKAPGAEEAFKKLAKAVQCLTDDEKKSVYDRYGDEERMPTHHRQAYQQDFMTPDDLFAAFFGGGPAFHPHHHARHQAHEEHAGQVPRAANLTQMLPVAILILLTLASNFAQRDGGSRFSFTQTQQYRNERTTASLNVNYFVADEFDEHYSEGTRYLAEFERQVEIYYVRSLVSECDQQEKQMYKQVMIAKRRGSQEELQKARNFPKPKCKEMERIKQRHPNIYRTALYMHAY